MSESNDRDVNGWINAIVAFGWWGFVFPSLVLTMTFTAKRSTADQFDWANIGVQWSLEVLASRIVWCVLFCFFLLWFNGRLVEFFAVFKSKSTLGWFALTSILIFINWLVFVIAAATDRLHQASLGYYMGPIFNMVLGYLFLGERLKSLQIVAIGFTCLGIGWLIFSQTEFPWISICLAASFGVYGLFRKKIPVDSIVGLTFETLYCIPIAVGIVIYFGYQSPGLIFSKADVSTNLLLFLAGPATAIPLICFAIAAKKLRLITLGFIQFLSPTGQIILARFVNQETIEWEKLVGYGLIWMAVLIYLIELGTRKSPGKSISDQ